MSHPYHQYGYQPPLQSPPAVSQRYPGFFPSGGSQSDESPISEVPPHLQNQMLPPNGYFPTYPQTQQAAFPPSTGWTSQPAPSKPGPTKTARSQFSACGACRHRRVKCDLKSKQEEAERGQPLKGKNRVKPASCTNCLERGMLCVDEFAPLKAAKQLRRGKRISEVEQLYGRVQEPSSTHPSNSSSSQGEPPEFRNEPSLPELTPEFFTSSFFKRLLIQRPIIDPVAFPRRYLSAAIPSAAAMGPEGAILCHVLFSWAASYGVNERGELDVPEGGGGADETERETQREMRRRNTQSAIRVVLKEIDEAAIMRKPSWDGVRCMLMVLPLTEGVATPLERLGMYECAVGQVYSLCSFAAINYDGLPASASAANGGTDETADGHLVRVRIYWYAFVHEGITTGLKGGRMILDEEDLDTLQDALQQSGALVKTSAVYRAAAKLATAPVRLAIACRLIHRALTGPRARKRETVSPALLHQAWEALEKCWEEFEAIRWSEATTGVREEELIRFADGWKIFLFEAQNVIRESLEHRLAHLTVSTQQAFLTDLSITDDTSRQAQIDIQHLFEIARDKCEVKTKQIVEIVKLHLGSRFFEWDASLVRDGTYYCALLLAKENGSAEDISLCLQALNELRWGFAKARERSENLRRVWSTREASASLHNPDGPWHPISFSSASMSNYDILQSVPTIAIPEPIQNYEPPSLSDSSASNLASPIYERVQYAVPNLHEGETQGFKQEEWGNQDLPLPSPSYGYYAQPPTFTPPIVPPEQSYFPQMQYDQRYTEVFQPEGYPYQPVNNMGPPNPPYQ